MAPCNKSVALFSKGVEITPTKYPRVNIVIDPPRYGMMQTLALENGISLSALAKALIQEALELREDVALASFAEEREKTYDRKTALTHEQVWDYDLP